MSVYVDFMTKLKSKISEQADRVYLEIAPEGATFPYVTYRIPSSLDNYEREDFVLEIDIWDTNNNTLTLEELTHNIDNELNRFIYNSSGDSMTFHCYRAFRGMIPEPDSSIRHRQLRYSVKTYLIST